MQVWQVYRRDCVFVWSLDESCKPQHR